MCKDKYTELKNSTKNSVLIIDDSDSVIMTITKILSDEYTIYAAKCGQGGISAAQKYLPDIILLDIVMPEIDGYAVITELKASEKTKDIPVIFITDFDNAEAEERGLASGAADYIPKPLSPTIVKLRIKNQVKMLTDLSNIKLAREKLEIAKIDTKHMMDVIEHRDSILKAVNRAASVLLTTEDSDTFERSLEDGMEIVGGCVDASCVEIWHNEMIDGELHAVLKHFWYNEKAKELFPDLITAGVSFPYSATDNWESILSRGEFIAGVVANLSQKDREFLEPFKIMSVLVIPVSIHGQFWGFCCIDDHFKNRDFTEEDIDIMRSGTLMMVNAWLRNEMLTNIREASSQLVSAFEQANAANKAKSDFLSAMSHEIRTPMNAIIGMTLIGKNTRDIDEKNRALNKIGDASSHLLGVINDVLDMAKIEANKLELADIEYNFEATLQKVMNVIYFRIDEKHQTLSVNIDKNIPNFIIGDDQRLSQVITNLISNAVKFTSEGGKIHLDASLVNEENGICELRIEVADSGIGVAQDQQERLFLPFEQAESGTSRKYGGTGLGLVISKRIVELMGGKIWVESELGNGAKFIFTIKAKRGQKDDDGTNNYQTQSQNIVEGEFANQKMLLAEDVEINREIIIALLENSGLIIDCVENGEDALNMIRENPGKYDIVFMDVQMPKMDGHEATRRIRAIPTAETAKLPIIAMTANVFKDDIEACLAAGMDGHIGKPLDVDKMLDILRKYLKREDT